jgi:hypothetical protein
MTITRSFKLSKSYSKNVLDVDCQTQGRLKLMIELYVGEKSVTNSTYLVTFPGSANLTTSPLIHIYNNMKCFHIMKFFTEIHEIKIIAKAN